MSATSTPLAPAGLLCELMENAESTFIRRKYPRFGWIVRDTVPDTMQNAYQILVASSMEILARDEGDIWDSGKVESSDSINVRYDGTPLESHDTYYWKVRTWNGDGNVSPYSEPRKFRTGEITEEYVTERYPLVTSEIEPLRIIRKGAGHYFIDFGRAAFGTIKLTLTSPDAREMEIHLGEAVTADQSINRNPGGTIRYRKIILPVTKGTQTYTVKIPHDQRNTGEKAIKMPQEVGEVTPFRYCEITNCPYDELRQKLLESSSERFVRKTSGFGYRESEC